MELQTIVAVAVFAAVYLLFSTRMVPRAVAGIAGALAVAIGAGLPAALGSQVPEALLVTAGLMVLAGFLKRSGLASWLALVASRASRGRPGRILVATGFLAFVLGALVGPIGAVTLVVPVTLLLAVELDVPTLPFVVVLSWTSLLGGTAVLTAHPANLWVASALGINGSVWVGRMLPLAAAGLAATLVLGHFVFRKALRATNERRARILEFEARQTLGNRPLVVKTVTALVLVGVCLALAPLWGLSPSLVVVAGALLLLVLDGPGAVDRALSDIHGGTLLFYAGLFAVVGTLAASGLPKTLAEAGVPDPVVLLWGTAVLGALFDHGAVAGALVPFLKVWQGGLWPVVVLGSTIGAGATVWGAVSNSLALGFAATGGKATGWKEFGLYGLLFAGVNLVVLTGLVLVLGH